jgi:hypothetical protein
MSFVWGAIATVVLLILAIFLTYAGRPKGAKAPAWYAVLLGKDGRLSTSKTVASAWTLVVTYVISVLILGQPKNLDWNATLKHLAPNYLLFLGGPFAALVLAKATVVTRVSSGTLIKSPSADGALRLSDLFNDDDGQPDLFDVQYVIFNVIAVVFVLSAFARATSAGFPDIPGGLVLLTAGPAAVYTSNKFFGSNVPTISAVVPSSVRVGQSFRLMGQNFQPATPAGSAGAPTLTVGASTPPPPISVTATSVTATAPDVGPDTGRPLGVVFTTAAGATAFLDNALTVTAPTIQLYGADTGTAAIGDPVTLQGTWDDDPAVVPIVVLDGDVTCKVRNHSQGSLTFIVSPLSDLATTRTAAVKVRTGGLETNAITLHISPAPAQGPGGLLARRGR